MKFLVLLTILAMNSLWAHELQNHSLILTHPSKHYQTGSQTILETQSLIAEAPAQIIALAQFPIAEDQDWYGLPIQKISYELFSLSGEHKLILPQDEVVELTVAGGYLSACLGRTLSTLVSGFITSKGPTTKLIIHLPMKAIFTGFTSSQSRLIPSTPYKESILDQSMDGLNIYQVLKLVPSEERSVFMSESLEIAIFDKSPMPKISRRLFSFKAYIGDDVIFETGTAHSKKEILFLFND